MFYRGMIKALEIPATRETVWRYSRYNPRYMRKDSEPLITGHDVLWAFARVVTDVSCSAVGMVLGQLLINLFL